MGNKDKQKAQPGQLLATEIVATILDKKTNTRTIAVKGQTAVDDRGRVASTNPHFVGTEIRFTYAPPPNLRKK